MASSGASPPPPKPAASDRRQPRQHEPPPTTTKVGRFAAALGLTAAAATASSSLLLLRLPRAAAAAPAATMCACFTGASIGGGGMGARGRAGAAAGGPSPSNPSSRRRGAPWTQILSGSKDPWEASSSVPAPAPASLFQGRQQQPGQRAGELVDGGSAGGGGTEKTPLGFILLSAAAIAISYADRSNLATSILQMAEDLQWSLPEQGLVLSSFFAGYAVTGVIGGYLADRFGGSRILQAGILLWSLFTFLTPAAAAQGLSHTIAARVLLGAGEGVAFPAVHSMIGEFVPPSRRSLAVAVITGASYVGAVIAFALTPWIIQHYGWRQVFYLFGAAPLAWFPLWWGLMASSRPAPQQPAAAAPPAPASTTLRSKRKYLQDPLVPSLPSPSSSREEGGAGLTWPEIRRIASRKEIWAILIAQLTSGVGLYGLLSWLPRYYNTTFGIDMGSIAAFTITPYVLQALVGILSGALADTLITAGWRVRNVRRILQAAGTLLPAACLLLATAGVGSTPSLASSFVYVTAGSALSALTLAAVSVSHLDVCPQHAGFVFAAGNTLATIGGLVSVPLSGFILERTGSFSWVFALFAGSYVVGALAYWVWVGDTDILGPKECDVGMIE